MLIANEIQGNTLNVMSHNAEQNIKMQEIDWRFFLSKIKQLRKYQINSIFHTDLGRPIHKM